MVATAVIGSAVIGAGASVASSAMGASAINSASQAANAQQASQFAQTQANIAPYLQTGSNASGMLNNRLTDLTTPITMDQATLQNTPGYQFNLQQGLKSVQNSAAARGLGVSGAAMKGAASYATGLADSTYQNQFNNANTNQTNAFNRLYNTASLGSNAAVSQGTIGQQSANAQSANTMNAGMQTANALTAGASGITNAANQIGGYYAAQSLQNNLLNASNNYNNLNYQQTLTPI